MITTVFKIIAFTASLPKHTTGACWRMPQRSGVMLQVRKHLTQAAYQSPATGGPEKVKIHPFMEGNGDHKRIRLNILILEWHVQRERANLNVHIIVLGCRSGASTVNNRWDDHIGQNWMLRSAQRSGKATLSSVIIRSVWVCVWVCVHLCVWEKEGD